MFMEYVVSTWCMWNFLINTNPKRYFVRTNNFSHQFILCKCGSGILLLNNQLTATTPTLRNDILSVVLSLLFLCFYVFLHGNIKFCCDKWNKDSVFFLKNFYFFLFPWSNFSLCTINSIIEAKQIWTRKMDSVLFLHVLCAIQTQAYVFNANGCCQENPD